MPTFVQLEPDAFSKNTSDVAGPKNVDTTAKSRAARYHHVRRPVRGIQIKDDTYATLQVRKSNGNVIPLFDAAAEGDTGSGDKNSNFLLQSITEQRAEKQQIILTFGEPYIFFFGEQPRMLNISGVLLNTEDFNWRAEWWENYDKYLRGTQCVRNKARVYLSWDDIVVEGYIVSANAVDGADNNNLVQFQFQMFLTNYQNISSIGADAVNAHWAGKDINLDPSKIDLPGNGGTSTTSIVRQRNIDAAYGSGQQSNSLFTTLMNASTQLTGAVATIQGQTVDLLAEAGRFISGRNVRIPVGWEGAAAFDQEVQISLASIQGANEIIAGNGNRVVSLVVSNNGLTQAFRANLENKFGPALTGQPLSANTDEFVARVPLDPTGIDKFSHLFDGQLAEDVTAINNVAQIYKEYGMNVDPGPDVMGFLKDRSFGIVPVQGAFNAVAGSGAIQSILGISG